jgi:DNA-binding CsgD family transcriptional regulator
MEEVKSNDPPKREEQVLVLAAGGMTDKEIALRLGISPDTVGTYWRRILAKYQAASRTEVVAKYTQQRAKAAVENLRYVNECLKLVADHMIEQAVHRGGGETSLADAILASAPDWLLLVGLDGEILFTNRPLPSGTPFAEVFESAAGEEPVADVLATGAAEGCQATMTTGAASPEGLRGTYDLALAPCLGEPLGRVVVSARRRVPAEV